METTLSFILSSPSLPPTPRRRLIPPRPPRRYLYTPLSPRACAPTPTAQRTTDARGFVLPEEGDVVLYQGRWADEDAAALVSSLRYLPSRSSHVVDLVELRRISPILFAVPSAASRRGKTTRWKDVADVRLVQNARYVPAQDAYEVTCARDGYAVVAPLDEQAKQEAAREYAELKSALLRDTVAGGVVGTVLGGVLGGWRVARAFGGGAVAAVVYLGMLQRGVDVVGKGGLAGRLLVLRFLVPAAPFVGLAVLGGGSRGGAGWIGSVSKADALATVLGLLVYKVPLLVRTGGEFVDGLAEFEMGKTGMVGTVLGLAARQLKKQRGRSGVVSEGKGLMERREDGEEKVLVFAGPSGVGKSTLIQRLMEEYPQRFAYSVSHTTRARREGEVDGEDYTFVSREAFEQMVEKGEFVEYAQVHGEYYGTSFASVTAVLGDGVTCILDVDVQGVEAVRGGGWGAEARFVWVAPPSVGALAERLRGRGSETEEMVKVRMETAMREMAYAATSGVFDLTVVNGELERAYGELRMFVNAAVPGAE